MQQPSRWAGLLWRLYVAGAVLFTVLAVYECLTKGPRRTVWAGLFNGFQAAVGLLLLSFVAPAALAEDRAGAALRCSCRRRFRRGAWCSRSGARITAPCRFWLFLPAVVALAYAATSGRWLGGLLAPAIVLAQGAAVTSVGIALATWVPRVDRALILSAAATVAVTVAWVPLAFFVFQGNQLSLGLASASPFLGVALITTEMARATPAEWQERVGWAVFWTIAFSVVAAGLLWAALASFDRCVGRIVPLSARLSRRVRPLTRRPGSNSLPRAS